MNPAVGPTGSILVATNHPSTSGSTVLDDTHSDQNDGIDYMDYWLLLGVAIACLVCIVVNVWIVCTISQKMHDNRNSIEAKEVIEFETQVVSMSVRKTLRNDRSIGKTELRPVVNNNPERQVIGSHVTIGGDVFDLSHVDVDHNHSLL
eukprot:713500_1